MPKTRVVRNKIQYVLENSDAVTITVIVGDAQVGGGTLWWDAQQQQILSGKSVVIKGATRGTDTRLVMAVKDISDAHDHTSITVTIDGGVASVSKVLKADAEDNGGEVVYIITIEFQ